jgi:hypothetical protein
MMKFFSKIILSLVLIAIAFPVVAGAQEVASRNEVENILRLYKNYRFGTINVYEISNLTEVRKAIKSKEQAESGIVIDADCLKELTPEQDLIIQSGADGGDDIEAIAEELAIAGQIVPFAILECAYLIKTDGGGDGVPVERAYLITNRPSVGQVPDTIIGLIISYEEYNDMGRHLRSVNPSNIFTEPELKAFRLDTSYSANTLFDLMENVLIQEAYINRTLEAQGIGVEGGLWANAQAGVTRTLFKNEASPSQYDIQKVMRISEASALDIKIKQNELLISPDLIRWKQYPSSISMLEDGTLDTADYATNSDLPLLGLELKYGIDEINYSSFWSERLTFSALWKNVKLGFILPTSGWSQLSSDMFDQKRKLTNGGVGIAGQFDFPIAVIPESGVFNMTFGYVFGDAVRSNHTNGTGEVIDWDPNGDVEIDAENNSEWLIRGNASIHYTFAVAVDADYWFRFGVGGTGYSAEKWRDMRDENLETGVIKGLYSKVETESVVGLSGRIEFMAKEVTTPFGASLNYFDEALGAMIWLQIPIVPNTFAIQLDAKGYFTAFKKDPRPWEESSIFTPMARFIVNF